MKFHQRLLAPVIFWCHWLYRRCVGPVKASPTVLKIPAEMIPLTKVGTIVLKYCEYMDFEPEALKISEKLEEVVDGTADECAMFFIRKILFEENVENTVYDWMVSLGDAHQRDRVPFLTYLTL